MSASSGLNVMAEVEAEVQEQAVRLMSQLVVAAVVAEQCHGLVSRLMLCHLL